MEVFKKCKWAHKLKPIKDWNVRKIKLKQDRGRVGDAYIVESCPNFKPDKTKQKKYDTAFCDVKPTKYCRVCGAVLSVYKRKFCSEKCCKIYTDNAKREKYVSRKKVER